MHVRAHATHATTATAALVVLMLSPWLPTLSRTRSRFSTLAFRATSTTTTRRHPGYRTALSPPPISCRRTCASGSPGEPSSPVDSSSTRLYHEPPGAVNDGSGTTAAIGDIAADDASDTAETGLSQGGEARTNPRSRGSGRKQRKEMEKLQQQGSGSLDWETFDFSASPKTDSRFERKDSASLSDQTGIPDHTISTNSTLYKTYVKAESTLDKTTSNQSLRSQSELLSLAPALVQRSIDVLAPFVQPRRRARIDEVLGRRTRHARFLFENPSNPSNVWACLRTLDSFGIQHVDVVVHSDSYAGKAAVSQKRGMRTAMGSALWVTVRQFGSLEEAARRLREEEGCLLYAADLNPTAKDVRDLTWDVDAVDDEGRDGAVGSGEAPRQRPICIVMGNEERGISDAMRELADETFYLPMCGFAESFNLSAATAITLAYMSAVSSRGGGAAAGDGTGDGGEGARGPLRPGDLDPHEMECLRLKGLVNSIAQKRTAKALLKKEGIQLPKSVYNE